MFAALGTTMNIEAYQEKSGPQKVGPITAFVARMNIIAIVIGIIAIFVLKAPAVTLSLIPYIINSSIFWGAQKQTFIKVGIFINYIFIFFVVLFICIFGAHIYFDRPSDTLTILGIMAYLAVFGVGLFYISAKKIKKGYVI